MDIERRFASEVDDLRRACPLQGVAAELAWLAAVEAERGVRASTFGEDRDAERLQELDLADDAVSAAMFPCSARTAADRELADADGIAAFDYFGIGQSRVGHVRVNGIGPVGLGRGSAAAADRLVVTERPVAEGQVVHRPLTRGGHSQRAEQHIDDALRSLDVASHHRRAQRRVIVRGRVEQTFGQHDRDRFQHTAVQWNVVLDEAPENVQHRRRDDGSIRVEVRREHRPGSREIDRRMATRNRDRHTNRRTIVKVVGAGKNSRQRGVSCPLAPRFGGERVRVRVRGAFDGRLMVEG